MPRYVYKCDSCGEILQVSHSIKERLETCECGESLQRIPSVPLILKSDDQSRQRGERIEKYISDAKEDLKVHGEQSNREEYE